MSRSLAECPETPNCVSSQAEDDEHGMDPVPFPGDAGEAFATVVGLLEERDDARITERDEPYVASVFTTRIMRFKDDVEFLVDADASVVHFRSASRIGSSDLGKNRSRMTELTRELRRRLG